MGEKTITIIDPSGTLSKKGIGALENALPGNDEKIKVVHKKNDLKGPENPDEIIIVMYGEQNEQEIIDALRRHLKLVLAVSSQEETDRITGLLNPPPDTFSVEPNIPLGIVTEIIRKIFKGLGQASPQQAGLTEKTA